MRPQKEKILHKFMSVACVFLLLAMLFTFSIKAYEEETTIQILVSRDPITKGETVNISIYCIPSRPIKAFMFSIYFNASVLQVNKITEGTIFKGYETFFNNGTIDNTKGEITDIYDVIKGVGTVSSPGYLVNISFTALSVSLKSQIQLVKAVVADEIPQFVPLSVINSSVTITPDWDINSDGDITFLDLILISNHFNERGDPGWIREDVNNNGRIDLLDFVLVAIHFFDKW